ncbi:MAG: hypothetical protein LAP21_18770 [Acidobacteriia bacterium]|nr:hypothetical protein [Terriglobia bacterium]
MSRIRGKANVDRILAYLNQQRLNTASSTEQEAVCAAWILVFATFYRPKEPAFAQALVVYGITRPRAETSTPIPKPLPFGVYEQTEIDGRTGRQWLQSVRDYLTWRSGGHWRKLHTASDRNHPEYDCYTRAVNFLNRVPQYFPVAPSLTGCVSEGQRFIEQRSRILKRERRNLATRKKPPASAALPAFSKTA